MKIKILSTSDVHGYIYPTNYSTRTNIDKLGMLKAGNIIKTAKHNEKNNEIVLAIENGDWIQGSPLTQYLASKDKAEQNILSKITANIGYDAATLGNHEFNYGMDYLKRSESKRNYPILNANITGLIAKKNVDKPYKIIKRKGIKVGIIGLTTAFIPNWEQPSNISGLQFNSALETAKKIVPKVRPQVDVLIVSYHGGLEADPITGKPTEKYTNENEAYRIMQMVPGIDALITGHQHRILKGKVNNVPFTQPGVHGSYVGQIEITLDLNKKIKSSHATLISTESSKPDYSLVNNEGLQNKVQNWLDQTIAKNDGTSMEIKDPLKVRTQGSSYIDFINKVQMDAVNTDISGTALLTNDITGYKKEITIRDIMNSYPYPNTIDLVQITGKEFKNILEKCASFFEINNNKLRINPKYISPKSELYNYDIYNGVDYAFNIERPIGNRLTKLMYHGKTIKDNQILLIAVNNYRAVGGGNFKEFNKRKIKKITTNTVADQVIKYLKAHPLYHAVNPTNLTVYF